METYTLITKLLEQLSYDENTAKNPNENYLKAIANAANALIELKKFYWYGKVWQDNCRFSDSIA